MEMDIRDPPPPSSKYAFFPPGFSHARNGLRAFGGFWMHYVLLAPLKCHFAIMGAMQMLDYYFLYMLFQTSHGVVPSLSMVVSFFPSQNDG